MESNNMQDKTVVISGASGMVGRPLVAALEAAGSRVIRLVRPGSRPQSGESRPWDPAAEVYDPALFVEADAVVHLAGENIAGGRWTERQKRKIYDSRVQTTRRMAQSLHSIGTTSDDLPAVFLTASAVGYYGERGEVEVREGDPPGEGFLAKVCQDWEAASAPAKEAGVRTVQARFGTILASGGGALGKMLGPFQWGLGGVLGSGRQYMSWIHLDDVVSALVFLLAQPETDGAYNLVAPGAVRNRAFTKALGRVLGRPTVLPAPAFALRLALGEMADELLLTSTRVRPERLLAQGFHFRFDDLETALKRAVAAS